MPFELYLILGYVLLILVNIALYRLRQHRLWAQLDTKNKTNSQKNVNKIKKEVIE